MPREWHRMSCQEAMELTELPPHRTAGDQQIRRFISRQPSWRPGGEYVYGDEDSGLDAKPDSLERNKVGLNAFGGCVYAQASLAAARVVEEEDRLAHDPKGKRSIHSIQGVFTGPGLIDRPFIFDVSSVSSTRSFTTRTTNARQPQSSSNVSRGPFPLSDAQKPMRDTCYTAITTFKRPMPSPADIQDGDSPQIRYRHILSQRQPTEWEPSPLADIDVLTQAFPNAGHGAFPMLDMYKVDMRAFNKDKPVPDRRELILYKLLKPLPREDVNAHIVCHAFEADRNGLIMLGNHLGWGFSLGAVASLSYAFYIHTNADEAVMHGEGFWTQEVWWPRVNAGRAMMEARIWSPEGRHVATAVQDGLLAPDRGSKI